MNQRAQISALEFTEQHYAALGKVIVAFQSLESTIAYGLLTLLQPEKLVPDSRLANAVVNEHSFSNKLKLLLVFPSLVDPSALFPKENKLSKIRMQDFNEAVELLMHGGALAGEAEGKRNQLMHSTWLHGSSIGGPPGTVLKIKARVQRKTVRSSFEYVTAEAIEATAGIANTAQQNLFKAIQQLHYLMHSN